MGNSEYIGIAVYRRWIFFDNVHL